MRSAVVVVVLGCAVLALRARWDEAGAALVALSAKDGLWAAVAPGGNYDKMEKVRLEATEDGAATLEKVLGYLKQEQKFGPQQ